MNKKGFLDISFSFIFAFIIGGFVIFGAIYGLNTFTKVSEAKGSGVSAVEFQSILNTFETSSESATSVEINFPLESRLEIGCESRGDFGKQEIIIDRKVNNQWSDTNLDVALRNNYIFAETFIEGKQFYIFSKPFEFPFKVANLIYLTHGDVDYCFIDTPRNIRSEINDLNQENLLTKDCKDNPGIKICFEGGSSCDVEVSYDRNFLVKDDETFPFETDAMMYAAIFSDKETYECGLKRLMNRAKSISEIYVDKATFLVNKCDSRLSADLGVFATLLEGYESSGNLLQLTSIVSSLDSKNQYSRCKLW